MGDATHRPLDSRQKLGIAAFTIGALLAIVAVFFATNHTSWQALLVFMSSIFNAGAAWAFSSRHKIHNSDILIALAHLALVGRRVTDARRASETLVSATPNILSGTDPPSKEAWIKTTGELSVSMSYIEDDVTTALTHWLRAAPWLLEENSQTQSQGK